MKWMKGIPNRPFGLVNGRCRCRRTTLTWPPDKAELRNWVNECANFESRNGKKQHVGFSIRTVTRENDPFSVDFWLSVDFTEGAWWFFNRVGLTFFAAAGNIWIALQHTGQYPIALSRRALVDLGTIWDCDWAGVQGGDYSAKGSRPPNAPRLTRYKSGWMVYLDRGTLLSGCWRSQGHGG